MGCGKGGKPLTFYQQIKNIPFQQAVQELGEKVGIKVEQFRRPTRFQTEYEVMSKASEFFQFALYNTEDGKKALNYLHKRGLDDTTIKHFEIGYASRDFQSLSNMLIDQKYDPNLLIQLGLTTQSSKDEKYYDIFSNRIMFPIKDVDLNVLGFSGRALDSNESAKYINSSESPIFKKGELLYHLGENLDLIKEKKEVTLFEGFFDVISAYQIGHEHGVATMGTALTDAQARLIRRFADTVLIAYDGDQAGIQAANKAIPKLKKARLNVNILNIPSGLDPDDYIKVNGKEGFEKLINHNVIDSYRYYYDDLLLRLDPNNANSVQIFIRDVNLIFRDASQVIKQMFEQEISKRLNIDFKFSHVQISERELPPARKPAEKFREDKYIIAESYLISELLRRKNHLELIKTLIDTNTYVKLENYQILQEIIKYYDTNDFIVISEFKLLIEENLKDHLERSLSQNLNWTQGLVLEENEIKDYINIIESYDFKRQEQELLAQMDENNPDWEILNEVNKIRRELKKRGNKT